MHAPRLLVLSLFLLTLAAGPARAGFEAPYTLGRLVQEPTHIAVLEIVRVDREKSLIVFKKLEDLKGKQAAVEVVHDIGKGGIFPFERRAIMAWAEEGKKAVFFSVGVASVTCTGPLWYQAYQGPEGGKFWAMSHVESMLPATYYGSAERLADAVRDVLAGKEVIVPCLADGDKWQVRREHLYGRGTVQLMRASLKIVDYNQKRDRVEREEGPAPRVGE